MLTPRGWALAGAAAGLIVGSRVLGAGDLAGLGIAGGLLIAFGALWVAFRRPQLVASRSVRPTRLHAGNEGHVLLSVTTTTTTPLLTLLDEIGRGRRSARFVVGPQSAGAEFRATYIVPTAQRGIQKVGPLLATVADPLGLVRRSWPIGPITEIVVCPRLHEVGPPHRGGGGEPAAHADGPRAPALEPLGEFLTLRDYEPGDDPRRVHWRASARVGELLVRQDEAASPGRVVLLLDTRPHVHDHDSFELAVEAVASLAVRLQRDHAPVEVTATTGVALGRPGPHMLEVLLDRLAIVQTDGPDHLYALSAALRHRLGIGAVVVATGALDAALVRSVGALRARKLLVTVVTSRPHHASLAAEGLAVSGLTVVDASTQPFAQVWDAVTLRRRSRQPTFQPSAQSSSPASPWPVATSRYSPPSAR